MAAEKGFLREIGSLAFHWAFLLLLVAVIVGKGTGYVGTPRSSRGKLDRRAANYDGDLRTGRFFAGGFSGTQITLSDFEDAYRDTGIPMDFHSNLQVANADGSEARDVDVRINHPVGVQRDPHLPVRLRVGAMMRVEQGNRVLFDGPVVLGQDTPPGENPLAQPWVGVIKLATLRPQRAIVLELYPDAEAYFRTLQRVCRNR